MASPSSEQFDYIFKFIIIGDAGAGKSCLLRQFVENQFKKGTSHTIGVEFGSKIIRVGNRNVKLQMWDTAGQERYRAVTRSYYRGAAGALIVYDITDRESYQHVLNWLADARTLARSDISIVMAGNKSDLKDSRAVTFLEASRCAQENDILFVETSAVSGEGVEDVFAKVARSIIGKIEDGLIDPTSMTATASATRPSEGGRSSKPIHLPMRDPIDQAGQSGCSCYDHTPEHVLSKLALAALLICSIWYVWVFDFSKAQSVFMPNLTAEEMFVIGVFLFAEFSIFLVYLFTHWAYPLFLHVVGRNVNMAIRWFVIRPVVVEQPLEGEAGVRLAYSYRPYGWLPGKRASFQYVGDVDTLGFPHGYGMWSDTSYHGECLIGNWTHGRPTGPFRSREKGSGATFAGHLIGYATSRLEALEQTFCIPQRSPEGLRFGFATVEASCSGGWFQHLPCVQSNQMYSSLSRAVEALLGLAESFVGRPTPSNFVLHHQGSAVTGRAGGGRKGESSCVGGLLPPPECDLTDRFTFNLVEEAEMEELLGNFQTPTEHEALASAPAGEVMTSKRCVMVGRGRRVYLRKAEVADMLMPIHVEREALVFLHGFNCCLDFALCKLGQLLALGRVPSHFVPFVFSQSTGQEFSYYPARRSIEEAYAEDLAEFLTHLAKQGMRRVHVLAHSMGARLFFETFERMVDSERLAPVRGGGSGDLPCLRNVILLNADVDREYLDSSAVLLKMERFIHRTTIYSDRSDGALKWSEFFTGKLSVGRSTRAVYAPVGPVLLEEGRPVESDLPSTTSAASSSPAGSHCPTAVSPLPRRRRTPMESVDIIDTTEMDVNVHSMRHSYFNINMQIIGDVVDLLQSELPARLRCRSLVAQHPNQNVYAFLCPPSFINADKGGL